jgi:nitrogen fixation protein
LTIKAYALVVSADNASRTYGAPNPGFTGSVVGLQNGDNITATYSTLATQTSPVGTYAILPVLNDPDGKLDNYSLTLNRGMLTVEPAPLVVAAGDASREYGQANPAFTATISGLVIGEDTNVLGGRLELSTPADNTSSVGTYPIVPSGLTATNYAIQFINGTLAVNAFALVISADNASRTYGAPNPASSGSVVGLQNGDNITVTYSTPATPASAVGAYAILPVLNDPDGKLGNYSLTLNQGTLTVTAAPLLVAAENASRPYGHANPAFTAIISGLVNGEDTNVLGGRLELSTPADSTSPVGTYPIVPSGLAATNYAIQFLDGTLAITSYALVVTADNASRTYEAPNPAFGGSMVGLQNGDNITVTFSTSATPTSAVGTYAIAPILSDPDGKLGNYSLVLNEGTLTVAPAPLLVAADNASRLYGQANPAFTATISGLVNGEEASVLGGRLELSTSADSTSPVGTYPIVPSGLTATNYAIQFANGTLTISKAESVGALASSAYKALPRSPVTFTFSLTPRQPGDGTPSGAAQFRVDGADYGGPVALVNGNVSISTDTLTWGVHSVSAEYGGDDNFLGATNILSPPQVINTPPVATANIIQRAPTRGTKAPVSYLLAGDSDADGESVVFDSVDMTSAAGGTLKLANGWVLYTPPDGFTNVDSFTYTIRDGLGALGIGTVAITTLAGGEPAPRLRMSRLGKGAYNIAVSGIPWSAYTFQYTDSIQGLNWLFLGMGMTDASGHFAFDDAPPPEKRSRFYRAKYQADLDAALPIWFRLTSSANPALPGSLVTFTASLTALAPGSGPPSGAVQFKVEGADYGAPVALVDGSATISTDTLPWGVHRVSAEYSGDSVFSAATNALSPPQTINTPPVAAASIVQGAPAMGIKLLKSDILAMISDADGETVVLDSVGPKSAEGGTLILTNGWIIYTPPSGPVNADSFTYKVRDGLGALGLGTVSVIPVVGIEPSQNLTVLDLGNGTYRILFSGIPWRTYAIQYSESLETPNWRLLGTRTANSQGQFEYDDTWPEGTPSRYYRAVSQDIGLIASPFRSAVWANFIANTNGRTIDMWSTRSYPPGWPNTPPVLAWNTNCLLFGFDGFTAISQCNEFEGLPGQAPVTLVTPRHGYMRGHGMGAVGFQTNNLAGKRVWFCTSSNTVVQMTVAASLIRLGSSSGRYYDHGLVVFTRDVPDSITPISVMSVKDFETYYYDTPDIPFLTLGTEQNGHCATGGDEIPPFIYPLWKGGDSGSPNMILSPDNKLVMFSGRSLVGGFGPQVQADIDTLSLYLGLNTNRYQLRWYDLTPWAP